MHYKTILFLSPSLGPQYRLSCLPYLVNLLHLHPLHTEEARPTRHIRSVRGKMVEIFGFYSGSF